MKSRAAPRPDSVNTEGEIAKKEKHPGACQAGADMTSGMEGEDQPCVALLLRIWSIRTESEEVALGNM